MQTTDDDDKRLSVSRVLASLFFFNSTERSIPSPANHICITCADQLSTVIGGNYQINFFREVVGWFGLAGGAAKSVTQLECIVQKETKKRGIGWVSLFCSEMAHGALRFSLTPPHELWNLGCNQSGA